MGISETWVSEEFKGIALSYKYTQHVLGKRSQFQKIDIYDTEFAGKILYLDGCLMITEKDHFIYHEMIVHPVMNILNDEVKRVLIIGGGDGGAVTELVKYQGITEIVLCEIDPDVVAVCKEHFPKVSSGLLDPRVQVLNEDGAVFAQKNKKTFDVILVDSTDPIGPALSLYEKSFYINVREALTDHGAAVFQTSSPYSMSNDFKKSVIDLRSCFDKALPYVACIPSYPGGLWAFTLCSMDRGLDYANPKYTDTYFYRMQPRFYYYNTEIHRGAFSLPQFAAKLIEKE